MLLISLLLQFTVEVVALLKYLLFKLLDTLQLILLFCARFFQLLLVANRLLTPSLFHHFELVLGNLILISYSLQLLQDLKLSRLHLLDFALQVVHMNFHLMFQLK
jgi:hypothetical protein